MPYDLPAGAIYPRGFDLNEVAFPPTPVHEFAKLRYGKALQEGLRHPGSIPVYGTNGRCGWHDTALAQPPGVILGRKGQGHLGVEWCQKPFWVIDTAYFAAIDLKKADPRWFYYITNYVGLDALKTGEKPGLNRDTFLAQVFPLPPADEQRAIAEVLGVLDDKIELNRQANHTLGEMASALFKSWFVDFNPVVAKAQGRKPFGTNPATAALFPDRLEVSVSGDTPVGWPVQQLGQTINLKRGYDLPAATRRDGDVPIVSSSGISGTHDTAKVAGPGVVTGRYGTIGQVFFVPGSYWPLNTTLYVEDFKGSPELFVFQRLKRLDFAAYAGKSAVPGINRNDVHLEQIVEPPPSLKAAYAAIASPWMELSRSNEAESRALTDLRDALLPKLLSGEIRLKQAEKAVEAAL